MIICIFILYIFLERFSECAHQTFTYDGRCYNTCPERSYVVQEVASNNIPPPKGLSLKRRASNIDEFDSFKDIIKRTETFMKNKDIIVSAAAAQKLCGSCHESCLKCNGPFENHCISCDVDYNQIIIGSSISCKHKTDDIKPPTALNEITNQLKSYSIEKIVLVSTLFGILLMITSICIYLLCIKCDCDILSSLYNQTKSLLNRASRRTTTKTTTSMTKNGSLSSTERGKYTYNPIVEMEDRPLTKNERLPDFSNTLDDSDSDSE
jgi:hypothetical protein